MCLCLSKGIPASGQSSLKNEPNLMGEKKREILLNAKVIASKQTGKGVTQPWKLTLRVPQAANSRNIDSACWRHRGSRSLAACPAVVVQMASPRTSTSRRIIQHAPR